MTLDRFGFVRFVSFFCIHVCKTVKDEMSCDVRQILLCPVCLFLFYLFCLFACETVKDKTSCDA